MQQSLVELLTKLPYLPAIAGVMALVALALCLFRFRSWGYHFTFFDASLVLIAMSTGSMAVVPLVEGSRQQAGVASMLETLRVLRSQIELYRVQHNGTSPLLFKGTFPQLVNATNSAGVPGTNARKFPLGPYLSHVPANPLSGAAAVTLTSEAPPKQSTTNRGWLYHQASGRIFIDLPDYLDR